MHFIVDQLNDFQNMQGSKGTLDGFPTKNHTIAVTRWILDKWKHCKAEGKNDEILQKNHKDGVMHWKQMS